MLKPVVFAAVVFVLCPSSESLKLPTYIKPCSKSDPKLDECARDNGQSAIPHFINGDRKYRIPSLNPLEITELVVDQGTAQVGLKIQIKDAKLYGIDKTVITNLHVDLDKQEFTWYLNTPTVNLISDYNVTGKILLLPIFGSGDCNITLANARYTYNFKYTFEKRKGEEYMVPMKGTITYKIDKAYIRLDNLFNGDKLLGTQMNKFLNENWEDASREIGPSIAEALSRVIDSILKNICETVPFKDVFLP